MTKSDLVYAPVRHVLRILVLYIVKIKRLLEWQIQGYQLLGVYTYVRTGIYIDVYTYYCRLHTSYKTDKKP